MEGVLTFCLNEHHPAGARAAAEILGPPRQESQAELLQGGPGPSPLVRAVRSPDARLRMAALEAIASLQPKTPFPGSSFVLEALAFQAASTGGRRAWSSARTRADSGRMDRRAQVPQHRDATRPPAAARRCGWPGAARITSWWSSTWPRRARPRRKSCSNCTMTIARPDCGSRWSARSGFLARAERIAESDPLVLAFSRPIDAAAARWQLARLNALVAAGVCRLFRAAGAGRPGAGLPGQAEREPRPASLISRRRKTPCWPGCSCRD